MKTQISKSIMKRLAMFVVPCLTVGALTVAAHADNLAAKIKGKGIVTMVATADDTVYGAFEEGDLFVDNHFEVKGNVNADGTANGTAHFVFGEEFSAIWGADAMTLECEIDTGSVSADGTVVLQGLSFEQDFDELGNVIFEELSPFEIIIDPAGSFSLRWCAIPALALEITKGHLNVK
jgi:hypothetical protein